MRIVIVGERRARKPLVESLRRLGFFPWDGGIEPPSNSYGEAGNYTRLEERLVQFDPVDIVFATNCISYLSVNDLSGRELVELLRNVHRGFFAKVKVVMFPGMVASTEVAGSAARKAGIPFLDDPRNLDKVRRIIEEQGDRR